MAQGQLADRVVHAQYLAAFQQQATFLLDPTAVALGAEDFWRSFVVDDRMPTSPTRRWADVALLIKHHVALFVYNKKQC